MQRLLRGAGAFFIRRDNQGRPDAAAYRRMFAGALVLLRHMQTLHFGGQSPSSG